MKHNYSRFLEGPTTLEIMSAKEWRYRSFYMDTAFGAAELSFAERRKVGCILERDGNIIGFGFNGTPAGDSNCCEDEHGVTLPSVVHAEANLVKKVRTKLWHNCTLYVTKEPCEDCAETLLGLHGNFSVVYLETSASKHGAGLRKLNSQGIKTYRMTKI